MYTRQLKRGDTDRADGIERRGSRPGVGIGLAMFTTVAMGICLFSARAGAAEDRARQADTFIRRGVELRQAGSDDAAAREFKKAYDLVRTPRAAAQLGLAEQALGRWEDAETHVSESLLAPNDPWIAKHAATLREALMNIKEHVGRVEIIAEPNGAEVFVNGRLIGKAPIADPVHVRAGDVQIEVQAPGYLRASRSTAVRPGQYQSIVVRLEKEGTPAAAVASTATATKTEANAAGSDTTRADSTALGGPEDAGKRSSAADSVGDGGSRAHAVAKWTAVGLAIGALALGTTATFIRYDKTSDFDNKQPQCTDLNGRAVYYSDPTMLAPHCQGLLDDYRSARTWQIVGFVGAGVFAVTAVVLALTQPTAAVPAAGQPSAQAALPKRARLFDWACTTLGTNPGLSCQARF